MNWLYITELSSSGSLTLSI